MMLPRIRDVSNWKFPPLYITPPRIAFMLGTTYVSAPYIGISYTAIDGSMPEGNVFWITSEDLRMLILTNEIKHIYKKDGDNRYRNVCSDEQDICKDCKGTGLYIGFTHIDICKTCNGKKFK